MPANSLLLDLKALKARLQRVVSCVTSSVLILSSGALPSNEPVRFIGFPRRVERLFSPTGHGMSVNVAVRPLEGDGHEAKRGVALAAYYYGLFDVRGREILAYHWHPHVAGVDFPHLHVSAAAVRPDVLSAAGLSELSNALQPELAEAHLPTGWIEIEDVVALVIRHFHVPTHRADWRAILQR
ncbi:MAG: hypothetical protein ACYDCQ_03250 [Dehalococcoidia bacterium]